MKIDEIMQIVEAAANVIYEGDDDLVVIERPSKNQFIGLMNRSQHKKLRGLLNGSLIIWDAYLATHAEVIEILRNETGVNHDGSDLELELNSIVMNSFWPDAPMHSPKAYAAAKKMATWLRKELSAYYGPGTSITFVEDGTYESITV